MSDNHEKDFVELIQEIGLFEQLSDAECSDLAGLALRGKTPAGKVLFGEGISSPGLFFIRSGQVDISKRLGNGDLQRIATVEAPSMLGEMSLITASQTSAQALARTDCVFYSIAREDFQKLFDDDNIAAYKILAGIARMLAGRLRAMDEEIIKLIQEQPRPKQEQFAIFKRRFFTEFDY